MELNEQGFLEELLALRRDAWESLPATGTGMNHLFNNGWSLDCFDEQNPGMNELFTNEYCSLDCFDDQNPCLTGPYSPSPCGRFAVSTEPSFDSSFGYETYYPLEDGFPQPLAEMDLASFGKQEYDTMPFPASQEECPSALIEDEELGAALSNKLQTSCKVELPAQANMDVCVERKNRPKKMEGQPSKNLMAERRRRKRLNDRLSMLRSVVPKISKMDRTSILGDTIDYMKELLERIKNLQGEIEESSNELNLMENFKEQKSNEVQVRNTPKFDVERRNADTRVEICCAGKPGLLLSTVSTLESLGIEIQQCVISCFNDFSLNASCSEEMEHRAIISSEEIKQALFRNAGYGGRCL